MMTDDYLWDRSGPPDPDVQRLERLVGVLALTRTLPALDLPARHDREDAPRAWSPLRTLFVAAAASLLLIVVPAGWIMTVGAAGWRVNTVSGTPRIGGAPIDEAGRLLTGQWLTTDEQSRAVVRIGRIGEVTVDPGSRLQMVRGRLLDQRLRLGQGRIEARIWAPPRVFTVETPTAAAVDLGCIYSLSVAGDGTGTLQVQAGWVAFEVDGVESFVPANGVCVTRPGFGPGTPHYRDAPAALQRALAAFDTATDPGTREGALRTVLDTARVRDAFTVWHLLARTDGSDRADVASRLARLVPPPDEVTVEGVLEGNRAMRDAWWNALGLDDAWWWRIWKGSVPNR